MAGQKTPPPFNIFASDDGSSEPASEGPNDMSADPVGQALSVPIGETQAGTNGSTAEIGTEISAEISDGEIIDGGQEIGEEVGGTADLGGDPAEDDEPKE